MVYKQSGIWMNICAGLLFYIAAEEMELLINLSDTRLFMISSCF